MEMKTLEFIGEFEGEQKVFHSFVVVQGERGLVTSNGSKFFFPDRNFKDATVGLYDELTVTVEKETYGFFKGKKTEVVEWDYMSFAKKNKDKLLSLTEIGGAKVLVECFSHYIKNNWFVWTRVYYKDTLFAIFAGNLVEILDCQLVDIKSAILTDWLNGKAESEEDIMLSCVEYYIDRPWDIRDITVFNENVITTTGVMLSVKDEVRVDTNLSSVSEGVYGEVRSTRVIPKQEVINFAKEHLIAIGDSCLESYSDGTQSKTIKFNRGSDSYTVTLFGGSNFTKKTYRDEETREKVKASYEGFVAFQKSCAKGCNSKTIQFVQDLVQSFNYFTGWVQSSKRF